MNPHIEALFIAIYTGNISQVSKLLTDSQAFESILANINYQLTADDIEKIKQSIAPNSNGEYLGLMHDGLPETAMTPLLMALSLERVTIAKMLMEKFSKNIDFTICNDNAVNHLHMLYMVARGDERYDKNTNQSYLVEIPDTLETDIENLSVVMVRNGHLQKNIMMDGQEQNLVALATMHGHVKSAKQLIALGLPKPSTKEHFYSIKSYLINNCPKEKAKERIDDISTMINTPVAAATSFFQEEKTNFPDVAIIKEMLQTFGTDRWANSTTLLEASELVEVLQAYIELANKNGVELNPSQFSGWIDGIGGTIDTTVKDILQSEAALRGDESSFACVRKI
jgi:hypothetical protein